jgi:hypothetical protein
MHLGGNWVDAKRQRWEADGWGPRRRGRVRSLSTMTIATDNFNAIGVSCGALVRTIAKAVFCFVEYHVRCRKAGGEGEGARKQLCCANNNLCLSKTNICREDKAAMLHLEPSSVGHSDKR